MKSTDITSGEIVIVRRPHQKHSTVTMFNSIDEAFNAYLNDMTYCTYDNIKNCIYSLGFDPEMDAEAIKDYIQRINVAGIKDNEPFIEFAVGSDQTEFYKADEFSKKDAVYACAKDDMNGAEMFTAEEGETYGDFQKRILRFYEGRRFHNAPSKSVIEYVMGVDWPEEPEVIKDEDTQIFDVYISKIKEFLSEESFDDNSRILEASKKALSCLTDFEHGPDVVNSKLQSLGAKSEEKLVEVIKSAAYPVLKQQSIKINSEENIVGKIFSIDLNVLYHSQKTVFGEKKDRKYSDGRTSYNSKETYLDFDGLLIRHNQSDGTDHYDLIDDKTGIYLACNGEEVKVVKQTGNEITLLNENVKTERGGKPMTFVLSKEEFGTSCTPAVSKKISNSKQEVKKSKSDDYERGR